MKSYILFKDYFVSCIFRLIVSLSLKIIFIFWYFWVFSKVIFTILLDGYIYYTLNRSEYYFFNMIISPNVKYTFLINKSFTFFHKTLWKRMFFLWFLHRKSWNKGWLILYLHYRSKGPSKTSPDHSIIQKCTFFRVYHDKKSTTRQIWASSLWFLSR